MTAAPDHITAGERRELRSVVRSQMKALRAEVKQRELELDADINRRLIEKFRDDEKAVIELEAKIRKLTIASNEKLAKLVEDFNDVASGGATRRAGQFSVPYLHKVSERKEHLRQALQIGMRAEISNAKVAIDRQEADLLKELALDGLKTDAAQAFLQTILSAKQLVPASKILELEAQYERKA